MLYPLRGDYKLLERPLGRELQKRIWMRDHQQDVSLLHVSIPLDGSSLRCALLQSINILLVTAPPSQLQQLQRRPNNVKRTGHQNSAIRTGALASMLDSIRQ